MLTRTVALLAGLTAVVGLAACGASKGTGTPFAPASSSGTATTATTATVGQGRSDHQLVVDGRTRTYHLYVPAGVVDPAPLVVFLHGGFGSGAQAERTYHWDEQADRGHFVVAYPDGLNHAWNTGGGCCGQPARDGVDDVAFISAMVRDIASRLRIDEHRTYATGISNGGIMSYTLACHTSLFAAIGPDSATQLGSCTDPAPTSVIHIHGTADTRIRYDGGRGEGVAHIDGPPVPQVNAGWRTTDDCATPRVTMAGAVTTSIATCPAGRAVELITIVGAGHQWPGSTPRQNDRGADPPSTALDATSTIWQFFAAHPRT